MNKAILVGWISAIKENKYGVSFTLKTCERGYNKKDGSSVPDIVNFHTCMARGYLRDYIVNNFRDNMLVEVVGKIYNKVDTKGDIQYQKTYIQVNSINLYNLINTDVAKSGAKNKATIGDANPTLQAGDDF